MPTLVLDDVLRADASTTVGPSRRPTRVARPASPQAVALTRKARRYLSDLGAPRSFVAVEVSDDPSVLADVIGFAFEDGTSVGRIRVGQGLIDLLSPTELDFVLAHEVVHIWKSHLVYRLSLDAVRAVLEVQASSEPGLKLILLGWDVLKVASWWKGRLPPDAALLRHNEYEADFEAVRLTGDAASAMSSLRKLAGDNLDGPSHLWEVFETKLPAMSLRERLAELDRRVRTLAATE